MILNIKCLKKSKKSITLILYSLRKKKKPGSIKTRVFSLGHLVL